MEKLSELTSVLLTIFASWRTGDKKRLGKNRNTNKANPNSDLQKIEVVYVSVQYTGQSEGYVNLEAISSSHSFPLSFCGKGFVCLFVVSVVWFVWFLFLQFDVFEVVHAVAPLTCRKGLLGGQGVSNSFL